MWLQKTFGDQSIPSYEADARTVDILYQLAVCNESRNSDISLLIDDMKQKTEEYESEGENGFKCIKNPCVSLPLLELF